MEKDISWLFRMDVKTDECGIPVFCGMSQEEIAEKSDLSYSTISHIESSSTYPMSIVALYRIASALNVTPYKLLMFD